MSINNETDKSSFEFPLIVVNPTSANGKALKVWSTIEQDLITAQITYEVYFTRFTLDLEGIRSALDNQKFDCIISVGGDGTLHDVVNANAEYSLPILIIGGGSGNDFATLMGTNDLSDFVAKLRIGKTRKVDLGKCNDRLFINGLGVGFDGEVARRTSINKSHIPPFVKYYLAIFKTIFFYKESDIVIEKEGGFRTKGRFFMISVANGTKYGGGFHVSPESIPDDGALDLVTIGEVKPYKRLYYLPFVLFGKHLRFAFVGSERVGTVRLSSDKPISAHLDGEVMIDHSFEVQTLKAKQTIIF